MTRKKVKLAFITDDSARKAAFKKRTEGMMKKMTDFSTLCGIDVCAIIYGSYEAQPGVCPSHVEINRLLAQLKNMPEMEQRRKKVSQEGFIRQMIVKGSEKLTKQRKDCREKEVREMMGQCLAGRGLQGLDLVDLQDLGWTVERKLKENGKRIESVKRKLGSGQEGKDRGKFGIGVCKRA